jgi:hypothetical protein
MTKSLSGQNGKECLALRHSFPPVPPHFPGMASAWKIGNRIALFKQGKIIADKDTI